MPWKPGQSGNPRGAPKRTPFPSAISLSDPLHHYRDINPELLTQSREKQAEDLRQGAYYIAKRCELKLHHELDVNARNIWDAVRAWGVASDKVLQVAESVGLSLFVPAQLLEKFMLAVNIKPASTPPQPVVIEPIHNDSTSTSD